MTDQTKHGGTSKYCANELRWTLRDQSAEAQSVWCKLQTGKWYGGPEGQPTATCENIRCKETQHVHQEGTASNIQHKLIRKTS